MRDITGRSLEKLESILDEKHVKRTMELQKSAFAFEKVERIPTLIFYGVEEDEWPSYNFMEIYEDREKMLLNELKTVYAAAKLKDDSLYGIRANYGTSIIASLFGCPVHAFDNMLPCGTAAGNVDEIRRIVERGIPDIYGGICGKALDTVAYFKSTIKDYPLINKYAGSMLLDIQGTFDNASIIWGSDIFLGVIDEPELVLELLDVISGTMEKVILEHRKIDGVEISQDQGFVRYMGGICLRNDSCINLSGEMYEQFVKPYDEKLLSRFTGNIHFCGKAHQWWERLLNIPGLKAINPFQSGFYDLKTMFPVCKRNKVAIYNWTAPIKHEEKELINTGMNRLVWAANYDEARVLMNRVYETGWVD